MKFEIDGNNHGHYYLILKKNKIDIIYDDKTISEKISISVKQYHEELLKFNSDKILDQMFFRTFGDAKKALEYIENKYGVMLALITGE